MHLFFTILARGTAHKAWSKMPAINQRGGRKS